LRFPLLLVACLAGGLLASPVAGQPADSAEYLQPLAEMLRRPWPNNRTIRIATHGHSVPAGYFKTPVVESFQAYPHLFHQAIKQRYPHAVVNVIVTAIGGENSAAGAARFEQDVLALRPDLVTIDYALNDRAIGLARAREAWTLMIEQAQAAGIKVILLTPSPDLRANLADPQDPLNQHAAQVRALAAEFKTGLVDSLALFDAEQASGTPLEDLMSQVNHPNGSGHALIAKGLSDFFQP
jgi:acyl-CoA thioesterase I